MRLPFSRSLLGLLAVAIPFASAQSSSANPAASNSAQVTTITTVSTGVTVVFSNGGRIETSTTQTILITSTIAPSQPAAPTSDTASAQSSSAASSTTTSAFPTGTASVVTDQAPSPGATGGSYGPDDSFINAAPSLRINTLLLGLGTAVVGGLLAA
ncbi:hypothetical protein DFH09DRAFT_1123496 [Mycena vulgaris]|nr:hypothetical protein DFH09DRAFT_1123496 [Mycena vulgaris]